jgi:iron complex transport system substrate-binding protein
MIKSNEWRPRPSHYFLSLNPLIACAILIRARANPIMKSPVVFVLIVAILLFAGCGRFSNPAANAGADRLVVISPIYNEIIWTLGAQDRVVGVDLSTTFPDEVKNVQTVGYHRALSAEGILSLHPSAVLSDDNIGPPQVVDQIKSLNIPIKSFTAKNDSVDGTKALIREMGEYFHKEDRAEELCKTLDSQIAAAGEYVKQFNDKPRVVVIHFGRASNIYMVVGKGGGTGDGAAAGKMVERAGGQMAVDSDKMQRMASPEIIAQANPDIILVTDFGFDRAGGSVDEIKALPGVGTSNAAKNNRIYRVEENQLMYFGPRTGENIEKIAAIIHQK